MITIIIILLICFASSLTFTSCSHIFYKEDYLDNAERYYVDDYFVFITPLFICNTIPADETHYFSCTVSHGVKIVEENIDATLEFTFINNSELSFVTTISNFLSKDYETEKYYDSFDKHAYSYKVVPAQVFENEIDLSIFSDTKNQDVNLAITVNSEKLNNPKYRSSGKLYYLDSYRAKIVFEPYVKIN